MRAKCKFACVKEINTLGMSQTTNPPFARGVRGHALPRENCVIWRLWFIFESDFVLNIFIKVRFL